MISLDVLDAEPPRRARVSTLAKGAVHDFTCLLRTSKPTAVRRSKPNKRKFSLPFRRLSTTGRSSLPETSPVVCHGQNSLVLQRIGKDLRRLCFHSESLEPENPNTGVSALNRLERAIVFDVGDTLIESVDLHTRGWQEAFPNLTSFR